MKLVIMQPGYLPWRGLFSQIRLADTFVFLDHVQLPTGGGKGKGFTTRVQVKTQHGQKWITIPVVGASTPQRIADVRTDDRQKWRASHFGTLHHALSRAPHWRTINDRVESWYKRDDDRLSELLISTTMELADMLQLRPRFFRSTEQAFAGRKSDLVLEMCKHYGATTYITGMGGKNYLRHEEFEANGVAVEYMQYNLEPYPQLWGPFIPYVTVLDLIANTGDEAPGLIGGSTIPWREAMADHAPARNEDDDLAV